MRLRSALLRCAFGGVALIALAAAGQRTDIRRGEASVSEIAAAETAFEQRTDEIGIAPAFLEFAGREAIMFLPGPSVINTRLQTEAMPGDLDWRPAYIVVASSGDLAASVGPAALTDPLGAQSFNYYLTVWRREAAGWRFIVDTNVRTPENLYAAPPAAGEPVALIARGRVGAGFDLRGMEDDLARDAARDARRAISSRLENEARVLRDGYAPAIGRAAGTALVQADPATLQLTYRDGSVSNSGDLAYAYGAATWSDASGQQVTGDWVRVWRRDGTRWRIAIDHLKRRADPPPPAPALAPVAAQQPAPMSPAPMAPAPSMSAPAPAPAMPAPVAPPAPSAPTASPTTPPPG